MRPVQTDPDMLVFGGSGSAALTDRICAVPGLPRCRGEVIRYEDGNLFVRVLENVRGRHVYLVQSTAFPANDHFMELLFWIDAFKRAQRRVDHGDHAVFQLPERRQEGRAARLDPRPRLCRRDRGGRVNRVVTLDLHAPQIQGFFKVPVDDLYAMPAARRGGEEMNLRDLVVVSPDVGFAKKARQYAARAGRPAGDRREAARSTCTARMTSTTCRRCRGQDGADRR